jgi:uncharacterized membrane protein
LALAAIVFVFGPDPATDYDREYEQEPPTDTPPALAPVLLRRGVRPESNEFTATLFDLVRRGYFQARAVASAADGDAGHIDLELLRGDRTIELAEFEVPVAKACDELVDDGSVRLSDVPQRLGERPENVVRFEIFSDGVKQEIDARGWYTFTAARVLLLASLAFFAAGMTGAWLFYAVSRTATFYYGAAMIEGAAVLFHASWITKLVRRRRLTPEGKLEAQRWVAFRRYLSDFPRLGEAPAASVELWERHLVYAIAFGLARRVLAGAALYRLEELSRSPIFWLGLEGREDAYAGLAPDVVPSRARRVRAALVGGR